MKVNFSKSQKISMGALVGIGLFNPFTVEVLDQYFKLVYTGVFLVCAVWVVGFILFNAFKPEQINLPTKKKKSEAYIAT